MDRRGPAEEVLDRIDAATRRVVLLYGPAASGKTAAAVAMYRRYASPGPLPRCLLLVPSAPAARHLRRRLVAESPNGIAIAPRVQTFAALAEHILAAAGQKAATIGPLGRSVLLRGIVDELAAAGKLPALAKVADTPGLVVALDRAIAELKRAAVEPDALEKALPRATAGKSRSRDLLAVYRVYQQRLLESDRYDLEGRMWLARDRLAGGAVAAMDDLDAIAVDGFTDFTPTQLEILALLSPAMERILITLPYAADGRERMWHWTRRTLDNIRGALADGLEELAASPAAAAAGGPLRPLWDTVFDFDAEPADPPAGLHVIAAAGADAEVRAAARRVKRLLTEGAPAGSIAVIARSMDACRPRIERIFRECDIPVSAGPLALTDVPIVRFALDVAALAPQFAFRDVLRVIKSSYFRPEALGAYDAATVAAAEMLIRRANVLEGRDAYARAAERLAARPADDEDEDAAVQLGPVSTSPGAVRDAGRMLEGLFSLAEAAAADPALVVDGLSLHEAAAGLLPRHTSFDPDPPRRGVHRDASGSEAEKHASASRSMAPQSRSMAPQSRSMAPNHRATLDRMLDQAELVARDLRALAELDRALAEIGPAGADTRLLRQLLAAAVCPPARGESVVDVLDVLDARALRYRHVFLLGAGQGEFPRRIAENSLIGESDRADWARRGANLDCRRDLTAREMLLFYLAVSRADRGLTISYQQSDQAGRAGAPGSFLLSLLAPLGGLEGAEQRGIMEKIPPGRFLPDAADLAGAGEALNAALAGLFEPAHDPDSAALAWAGQTAPQTLRRSAAGLFAFARRWAAGQCDSYDGRLTHRPLLSRLARRFPGETVFSATQLNAYAQCPWSFFARYVLDLAPLDVPQRELQPVARGIFCHNVLFRAMAHLRSEFGPQVRLGAIDEPDVTRALDQAVAAESAAVGSARPPYPALWEIQRRRMSDDLADYLRRQRETALDSASLHFELGFGPRRGDPELSDPAGRDEPITIATPAGDIRISGKIDRVDSIRFEDAEGLLVIDYKTGRLPSAAEIRDGRNVQLPLYAAAVGRLLDAPPVGGAFHKIGAGGPGERLFAAVKKRGSKYSLDGDYEQNTAAVFERIGEFIDGMRAGRFDAFEARDCPGYCPYRQICHYSDARAEIKATNGEDPQE